MSKYLVHFKVNPSAWPSDPAQVAEIWERAMAGGNHLLDQGLFEQIGWVSGLEGYGLVEAGSKAGVMELVTGFYPLFSQDIMEFTPHPEAGKAIVAGAKMAGGSS